MGKVSRPRILTKDQLDTAGLPEHVQVALAEVAERAREGVLALSVACGLQVVGEILAADVARVCGAKGKHDRDRVAYRHGTEPRQLSLGGALVQAERPRVRTKDGREVALPTWEVFSQRDLLGEIALGRMLAGLSTRRYRPGAEPVGEVELRGTSRSTILRRFRRATAARLAELFGRDISGLDLLAVFIDGMHVGEHLIVVALGVDPAGRKHPLGLWEGTTENAAVCRALVAHLIDRGLPADRAMLLVTDGGRAIRKVIRETWAISPCTSGAESTSSRTSPRTCPSGSVSSSLARCGPRGRTLAPWRPSGSCAVSPVTWSPLIPVPPPRSLKAWRRPSPSAGWACPIAVPHVQDEQPGRVDDLDRTRRAPTRQALALG